MLCESGAPLGLEHVERSNICQFAAMSTAAIQALLDRGVAVGKLFDSRGLTPLHEAARLSHDVDVLSMLVTCGNDLEARDSIGFTCAGYAAFASNVVALRWLVGVGAAVNCVDKDKSTMLHVVSNYDCAVCLLAAGADARARDGSGRTPLHLVATQSLAWPVVEPLLAAGADLDVADNDGRTARQLLSDHSAPVAIDTDLVEAARRDIAKARLDFVRDRALEVCISLQSLKLNALQMCEILVFACGPVACLIIPFHIWWKIATTVKHFQTK